MQAVDALVADLMGNDPLLGIQALDDLRQVEVSEWPEVFQSALQAKQVTRHGKDRLARLCAHLGTEAARFLVEQIETGEWSRKRLAAGCFKYIRDSDVIANLAKLVESSTEFDVQRNAIAALGEAGADGWSRLIVETTMGPEGPFPLARKYQVEKLAPYAAESLAKMVVREDEEHSVGHDLFMLDLFLKRIWNQGKIAELYPPGETQLKRTILDGLREISPTAATPLQREWLHSKWSLEQEIAAEALYDLPLDRVATELGKSLLDGKNGAEARYQCAISLMSFSTAHAHNCLKPSLPLYSNADPKVAQGILWAYSGLFFYAPPVEWNEYILSAIRQAEDEPKAQLLYGFGIWSQHPELIDDGLGDLNAFTRAVAALALARSKGENAIPKLRKLRRDGSTALERLFVAAALVHAGDKDSRKVVYLDLCKLPPVWREVSLLRHIWKREIISALNSESPPWTPEAIAWAEVMSVDLQQCMEEAQEIARLNPPKESARADVVLNQVVSSTATISLGPLPSARTDFVIVVPLAEERDAVLARLPGYQKLPPKQDDIRVYYAAELPVTFPDDEKATYSVIVMPLAKMGHTEAGSATGDAIRRFKPRYVLLVGIAGGMAKAGVNLGDVLVSDQVADYELAKVTSKGSEIRWQVHSVDQRLLIAAQNLKTESWHTTKALRPNKKRPMVHYGPICTGNKVVADESLSNQLREVWVKLIGVEMEASGVANATSQSARNPGFFMIRGVSDLADRNKDSHQVKRWRSYACEIAAAWTLEFLKSGPALPSRKRRIAKPSRPNHSQGKGAIDSSSGAS